MKAVGVPGHRVSRSNCRVANALLCSLLTPLEHVAREVALARMPRLARCLVVLLAVAFADEADDTRAAAAADHLRAGELKELLTKAGVEFGCAHCH